MLGEEGPASLALQKAVDASGDFPGNDEARRELACWRSPSGTATPAVRTELENCLCERPNDPADDHCRFF